MSIMLDDIEIALKNRKETNSIEFKEGQEAVPKSIYETVCSFSNRNGGLIILGVTDGGGIQGVNVAKIEQMKKDFATAVNSPNKINPPLYLELNEYFKEDNCLLYVWVPSSSQIHRLNNSKIMDRIEDADIDITNNTVAVQNAYNRKQQEYTENKIYEFVEISDLRADLIAKVRKAAVLQDGNHEFQDMDDLEILKSLQMYKRDFTSGKQGFTLASILVLVTMRR